MVAETERDTKMVAETRQDGDKKMSREWQRPRERCRESGRGMWGWWQRMSGQRQRLRDAKMVAEI